MNISSHDQVVLNETVEGREWIDKLLPQMKNHSAWHEGIDAEQAEQLLRGQPSFTYVFRSGKDICNYLISFVGKEGSIVHSKLVLTERVWVYYNGSSGQSPYIGQDLPDLIPIVMRCDPSECLPLASF